MDEAAYYSMGKRIPYKPMSCLQISRIYIEFDIQLELLVYSMAVAMIHKSKPLSNCYFISKPYTKPEPSSYQVSCLPQVKNHHIDQVAQSVSRFPFVSCQYYNHDNVIKWKHFSRYWPFVRWIHRSPVNSPHKGQWRGALMFTLICGRINGWVNNR